MQYILYAVLLISKFYLFPIYGIERWKGLIPIYSGLEEDYAVTGKRFISIIHALSLILTMISTNAWMSEIKSIMIMLYFWITIYVAIKKRKYFNRSRRFALLILFFPFAANFMLAKTAHHTNME